MFAACSIYVKLKNIKIILSTVTNKVLRLSLCSQMFYHPSFAEDLGENVSSNMLNYPLDSDINVNTELKKTSGFGCG